MVETTNSFLFKGHIWTFTHDNALSRATRTQLHLDIWHTNFFGPLTNFIGNSQYATKIYGEIRRSSHNKRILK